MQPLAAHAASHGFELRHPPSLKTEGRRRLAALEADVFVVVAYGLILPPPVLAMPRFGCINGHASLLPRWRGAAPIQRAIAAGDSVTGICAMLMEAGLDTGPVLARREIAIGVTDTAANLHDRLAALNAELLGEVVAAFPGILKGAEIQDDSQAVYAPKLTPPRPRSTGLRTRLSSTASSAPSRRFRAPGSPGQGTDPRPCRAS